MKRWKKRVLKAALIIPGVFVLIILALQIGLNSKPVDQFVRKLASENIDATIEYSDMHFSFVKHFPTLRVKLDSLSITYPHERFTSFDMVNARNPLLKAGRGEVADTLARVDRFVATVNVWHLAVGKIRLTDASVFGMKVFARSYADSLANWQVFGGGKDEEETEEKDSTKIGEIPWISIGDIHIGDEPSLIYTSQPDTIFAGLKFKEFNACGDIKLNLSTKRILVRGFNLDLDTLRFFGRLPSDTVALFMDSLRVRNYEPNCFTLATSLKSMAMTGTLGRFRIPASLSADIRFEQDDSISQASFPYLKAEIAGIPIDASGVFAIRPSDNYVKADVDIRDCELKPLVDEYAVKLYPQIKGLLDEGKLSLSASVDGALSSDSNPKLDAEVALTARGKGAKVKLDGSAKDALGKAMRVKLSLDASANLDSLNFLIPENLDSKINGSLDIDLNADASLNDLTAMRFTNSRISGRINSRSLKYSADSLYAVLSNPIVNLSAKASGLEIGVGADTVAFKSKDDISLRARGMKNTIGLTKVKYRDRLVPKISATNSEKGIFVRYGNNKFALRGLSLTASATKRVRGHSERFKHFLDSLQRVYPEVSRDSLIYKLPHNGQYEGSEVLSVSMDSSVTRILKEWRPEASASFDRAFVVTPSFPLRTRINAFKGTFTENALSLDTLAVVSGRSDIEAKGEVKGLRRLLMGRVGKIETNATIKSKYINANEILAAISMKKDSTVVVSDNETEESFVADTISTKQIDTAMKAFMVPANLEAKLRIKADSLDYSDLHIKPFSSSLAIRNQTLQLSYASMRSNLGDIFLSAYYSTPSRNDISVGMDLKLQDISAEGIIKMIPEVDHMMPALKSFQGDLNCDLALTGKVDSMMNLIMPTLDGVIKIGGEDLYIADAGALKRVTGLLLFKNKNIGAIDNMTVGGVIHDSKLEVYPFELSVDRYDLALQGVQRFDKKLDYQVSIMKSPLLIPFGIRLFGDTDHFKFRLTSSKYRRGQVPVYTETLDSIRFNIRKSITDIYRVGVDKARMQNIKAAKNAAEKMAADSVIKEMSISEQMELDLAMMAGEVDEQTREIEAEANAILKRNSYYIYSEAKKKDAEDRRSARKAERTAERQKIRQEKK